MMALSITPNTLLALVLSVVLLLWVRSKRQPKFPPGPPGVPILGNLFDIPSGGHDWEVYGKWADQWGPVVSASAFGTTLVIINSYQKAWELLDKKSTKYSGRPHFTMAIDLMGWGKAMAFTSGSRFRGYRKVFHEELGNWKALRSFYPQEEDHAKKFVRNCLRQPERLAEHCFQHAGAIILRVAYGYTAKDENDEFIRAGNIAMDSFNEGCSPSRFMVNQVPILKYVPEWVPGAGFQKIARLWKPLYGIMVDTPFNFVKQELAAGTAEDSFTAKWLKRNPTVEEEDIIKNAAGSMFGGGGETTAVLVHVFFLLMTLHPEILKKAQEEMDSVVGRDRLPTMDDREGLPYLEALVKETFRMFPPVPDGLPHATTEDDIHDGYFIPKGAIVISNIWKMCRDTTLYPSPTTFNPSRYLGANPNPSPYDVVFGFGRRICPGRLLADVSVWVTIAMVVWAFDVQPSGAQVLNEEEMLRGTGGAVNHLEKFKCGIVPRDPKVSQLLVEE